MPTLTAPAATSATYAAWPMIRLMESAVTPTADTFHRSWIQYMPLGKFHHPEYGNLDFSRAKLQEFKRKFDGRVRGIDIALDTDHKAGEAPGWIERLELHDATSAGDPALTGRPAGLYALIKWTPLGVSLLKEQRYRYFSPEFGSHYDEVTGKKTPGVILGGALTNRPFLKSMDAVTLSEGVSRRPWSSVNKSLLPRSCFLIQGDAAHKATWKLPVYEGAGPKDADGHYTKRGPLNLNAVHAALAAVNGGRTGEPMTGVPPAVKAKLLRWLRLYGAASQQHSEPSSESLSPGVPAARRPARSTRMTKTLAATTTADRERAALEQALLAEEQALLDGTLSAEELMADEDTTVTLSSKGAAKKKAKAAAADDEEDMDDVPMPDDQSYDDGEDGADSEPDGDVDDEEDTHGPVTTPKKGHAHGKYGLHTHADDADHSDAPLAEDDSAQMSETPARRTASPAASYELGELSALLSEDDDESVTLDDVRAMKAALRQLAEERVALREQQYREEVTRLSEGFVREMRLPTVGGVKGGKATLAPSRVFRGRFERFMLSDTMRGASDEDRNQFLQLLHTAYLHGAVPVTQLSEKAPAEGDPTPPAQLGSRADRPAASSANSASKHAEGTAPSRLILLAEAKAKAEHNKTLSELTQAQRSVIYAAAARDVNYQGAER